MELNVSERPIWQKYSLMMKFKRITKYYQVTPVKKSSIVAFQGGMVYLAYFLN